MWRHLDSNFKTGDCQSGMAIMLQREVIIFNRDQCEVNNVQISALGLI